MTPARIQRRSTKGWRSPTGAVYVGRGSKWGNPWVAGKFTLLTGKRAGQKITAKDSVQMFRNAVELKLRNHPEFQADIDALAGRDLMCWCPPDQPCHADVLLEIANKKEKP